METEIDRHSFGHLHQSSPILNFISQNFQLLWILFLIQTLWTSHPWWWWWKRWFDKVGYWAGFWDNYLPVKHPHPKPPPSSEHRNFFSPTPPCFTLGSALNSSPPTIPAFPTIMPANKRATPHHRMKPAAGSAGLLCLQWGIFYTNFGLLSSQWDLFYTNFLVQVACGVKMVTPIIDRNFVTEMFTKCMYLCLIQDLCWLFCLNRHFEMFLR